MSYYLISHLLSKDNVINGHLFHKEKVDNVEVLIKKNVKDEVNVLDSCIRCITNRDEENVVNNDTLEDGVKIEINLIILLVLTIIRVSYLREKRRAYYERVLEKGIKIVV